MVHLPRYKKGLYIQIKKRVSQTKKREGCSGVRVWVDGDGNMLNRASPSSCCLRGCTFLLYLRHPARDIVRRSVEAPQPFQ